MFAQGIILILIVIGFCYGVWRLIILPRFPVTKEEPDHVKILEEKLEKLQEMKEELESAREEKEVTKEIRDVDDEIEDLIKEIQRIENA